MKKILLTQGCFALVDDADYEYLNQFKWCVRYNGYTLYAQRHSHSEDGKPIHVDMHREILGLMRGDKRQCDHRDHNGLNNQCSNLRICTRQQNQFNQNRQTGTSKFKGVCWQKKAKKWRAEIRYEKKTFYIGLFANEIDAAKAYDTLAKQNHGEFARLNFPDTLEEIRI